MIKKYLSVLFLAFLLVPFSRADEGMWLLTMLQDKYKDMRKKGLKLKPKDIYDINHSSLKDAICTMNHGSCTGEVISGEGLVLTNHHCGYGAIQSFSTEENDYLTDGFWAMNRGEELHVPGMTYTFLVRIEDVTSKVLEGIEEDASEIERYQKIRENKMKIVEEAIKDTHYEAEVKEFFDGNEYYLFVNETFEDVRLVGAPPSSIGKYGGDTDNWMWPRHTGDFSMFRIYAGEDNKPAPYSKSNKPYDPKHHLPINIAGVEEGDYAMILGYPGNTDRFLTSYGVKLAVEQDQPARVRIRRTKLDIMKASMDASDKVRIQYASKYAQVSNYWKYFIGQSAQLVQNNVYEKKKAIENEFEAWVNEDEERKEKYGSVISDIAEAYEVKNKYWHGSTYLNEAVFGPDINVFIWSVIRPYASILASSNEAEVAEAKIAMLTEAEDFFKDYHAPTDKKIFIEMMSIYRKDVPAEIQPDALDSLFSLNGTEDILANYHDNSPFTDLKRFKEALETLTYEDIQNDLAFQMINDFIDAYRSKVAMRTQMAELKLDKAKRLFVEGLREMNPDKIYAPDANSTLRLTYGTVEGYDAKDAVYYDYFTTIDGLMAKKDNSNPEFVVPDKLAQLYKKRDFGRWGEDGTLRVCFISDNDITGGNSGSPVIDGKGRLIGCAFDGNWEAMSGDIFFETELQRTISVDIRYILFIIDKYADADHLIDEMDLVD